MIAALLALGLAVGVPPTLMAVAWLAYARPYWFLAAAAAWAVYSRLRRPRPPGPREEAVFLEGVAAELRAGAALRGAIADAADRTEIDVAMAVRMAQAGRPMEDIAASLRSALPVNGAVAGPALVLASSSGSGVAGLFDALALRAAEAAEAERESRAVTAQARLSAWLIGGVPAAIAVGVFVFGGIPVASGPGLAIAIVGFGLQATGALAVWAMVHRGAG